MFTAKRLVLLLLTGIIIATVACGPKSEEPEIVKEVKPRPTSVTFPTLPPEYRKLSNTPPTPIPPKHKNLNPEEFVEQHGIKRRSGPISSYGDVDLLSFSVQGDTAEGLVHNTGNIRSEVCLSYDVYKSGVIVESQAVMSFDIPANKKARKSHIILGDKVELLKFTEC